MIRRETRQSLNYADLNRRPVNDTGLCLSRFPNWAMIAAAALVVSLGAEVVAPEDQDKMNGHSAHAKG